jgi:peptidoglycan hydrolase-like protein with peptidoglycan-binding domain
VRIRPRTVLAGAGVLALVATGVVIVADPFSTPPGSAAGVTDNSTPIALDTVRRRSLSSQTQLNATLGYADAASVVMPAGSSSAAVVQAQQAVTTAQAALQTAQAGLETDRRALAQAQAVLAADRARLTADCAGDNAASTAGACATDQQAVATDRQSATGDADKVTADTRSVSAARSSLAGAAASLATARASAAFYGATSTYTMLPPVGKIVRRGQPLYAVDGAPALLLYGTVTAWRAFVAGMSPGSDVAELNANLRALGYAAPSGNEFTAATQSAVAALQRAHGLAPTGELRLGSVVFERGAVRVTTVQAVLGGAVQPGAILAVTSTVRQVTIDLDAAQQSAVKVGDRATITLPDSSTTPGVVSAVGSVATTPSGDSNGQPQTPTVEVHITPSDPAATGRLDQAPVQVSITTATVRNALVVPVNALLALAGGGYAVEVVDAGGVHRLVAVEPGLFDDAEGLVQVTGDGLRAGQRIVVPAT